MITTEQVASIVDLARGTFPGAAVTIRHMDSGRELEGFLSAATADGQITTYGVDDNYRGSVRVKTSEMPREGMKRGERITIKDESGEITYTVLGYNPDSVAATQLIDYGGKF